MINLSTSSTAPVALAEHATSPPPLVPAAGWGQAEHEVQVFVDDSGRRARRVRGAGLAVVATWSFWFVGLMGGMVGFGGFPAATTGLAPTAAHRVLAGKPADRDRTPLSGSRAVGRVGLVLWVR
jgi:hypothetical protein